MAATNFSLNDYLIIDTTGSIGIGTTTPGARLFVTSSSTDTSQPGVVFKAGTANQLRGAGLFDVQNSSGTTLLFVSGSGNVGIGTSSPTVRLDVSGSYSVGTERARIWGPLNLKYSTDTINGKDYQIGSGYELDGTAHGSGGFVLYHRWGDSGLGSGGWKMIFGSASVPNLTIVNQTVGIDTTSMSEKMNVQGSSTTSISTVLIKENQAMASGVAALDVQNSAGTSLLFVSGSGRVGINSSAPTAELTVRYATANSNTLAPALLIDNPSGGGQTALTLAINGVEKSRLRVDNSGNLVINAPGVFYFGYDNSHSGFRFYNGTGSRQVDIDTSGNVGIGTATMSNKLSIYGTAQDQVYIRGGSTNRAGIRIDNTAGYQSQILLADNNTDRWQIGKQTDNTFFLYDATAAVNIIQGTYRATGRSDIALVPYQNGRVGIGTDPAELGKLEIYATGSLQGIYQSDGTRWLRILAGTSTSGAYNNIVSENDYALIFSGSKATNAPGLVLAPWDGAGATSGLKIDPSGNVGIGTATMSRKLVVHGSDALINGIAVGTGNNNTSTSNTAVGDSANGALSTGSGNTAVGYAALITVSTGNNNVAVGSSALQNQTASNATAVGTSALTLSTVEGNTAVGYNALSSITANSGSVAVGYEALKNATGSNNTALGWWAGRLISTGTLNVAIGPNALRTATTTSGNVAVGSRALELNTGSNNTSIGGSAGYRLTTGSENVVVGSIALAASTSASYNTAIGVASLATCTGNYNVALGHSSGISMTSGEYNAILGSYSGNNASLNMSTSSRNVVLSDGEGNIRARFNYTGAVGIGTASPIPGYTVTVTSGSTANGYDLDSKMYLLSAALEKEAGYYMTALSKSAHFRVSMATPGVRLGSSTSDPLYLQTNNTNAISIDTSQNVGIGTDSTGGEALRIYRSSGATAAIYSNTSNATIGLTGYNSTTPVTAALEVSSTAVSIGAVTNHPLRLLTNSTEAMRINTSQNVGIGTATVGARLHVHSGASDEVTRFESTGNPYISLYDSGTRTGYLYSNTSTLELVSEATKDLMLQGAGAVIIKSNGNNERIRVLSGGKVGFGTNNPSEIIESYGTDAGIIVHYSGQSRGGLWAFSSTRVALATTTSGDDLVFGYTGSPGSSAAFVERMRVDNSTGYVGIGTNGPVYYLDVRGGFQTQAMYPRLNNTYNIGYSLVGIATAAYSNVYSYAYPSLSDYRLKEEIREISGSLPKIANLRPVVYRYNDILENIENLGDRVGFIAHELQEQFPNLVRGEKDAINEANGIPKMQEIYQDDLLPYMVDAIKELKSQNDSLKSEIQSLKDQISSILTMLGNK
jgi:hypothetical protein